MHRNEAAVGRHDGPNGMGGLLHSGMVVHKPNLVNVLQNVPASRTALGQDDGIPGRKVVFGGPIRVRHTPVAAKDVKDLGRVPQCRRRPATLCAPPRAGGNTNGTTTCCCCTISIHHDQRSRRVVRLSHVGVLPRTLGLQSIQRKVREGGVRQGNNMFVLVFAYVDCLWWWRRMVDSSTAAATGATAVYGDEDEE